MEFTDERLQTMLRGRRAVRRIPFPGLAGAEVGVRVLTEEEIDLARVEAQRYVKTKAVDLDISPEFYDREFQRQIVWRAFVDPDVENEPPRFFPTPVDVRRLDAVMLETLYQAYLSHQEEGNPLTALTREEVDAIIAAMGKGQSAEVHWSTYDAPTLRRFLISIARHLSSSPTGRSSTGPS